MTLEAVNWLRSMVDRHPEILGAVLMALALIFSALLFTIPIFLRYYPGG